MSTGEVFSNPKWFRKLEENLVTAQRILSRRVKGSSNWNKQRVKVARIHEKITHGVQTTYKKSRLTSLKTTML